MQIDTTKPNKHRKIIRLDWQPLAQKLKTWQRNTAEPLLLLNEQDTTTFLLLLNLAYNYAIVDQEIHPIVKAGIELLAKMIFKKYKLDAAVL